MAHGSNPNRSGAGTLWRPSRTAACLLALLALLAGCQFLPRPATVPLAQERHPASCTAAARAPRTLVVLLPGVYDRPGDFAREGFVQALADARVAADAVAVDWHRAYFDQGSAIERLRADVIDPARRAGYRRIWLVGVSLGGFGALLSEAEQPGGAEGLVLIAPYLGEPALVQAIAAAGLARWQAPPPERTQAGAANAVWGWLQSNARGAQPEVWLGAGRDDRFAEAHRLLAAALPEGRSVSAPGGHDWPAWRAVWRELLGRLPLPHCAA